MPPAGSSRARLRPRRARPRRSRCSRWPTATSACAATSTRASRAWSAGHLPQRLLRDLPARVRRARLRLRRGRPARRQRPRRQDHPAARRERAGRRRARRRSSTTSACWTCARGSSTREMVWRSAHGERIRLRSRRLVSFVQRSVAAIDFEVEALDRPLRVALQSSMLDQPQPRRGRRRPARRRASSGRCSSRELRAARRPARGARLHRRRAPSLRVAAGMDHVVDVPDDAAHHHRRRGRPRARDRLRAPGARDGRCASRSSSPTTGPRARPSSGCATRSTRSLENALAEGWDGLARSQEEFLDDWWERADIELEGDDGGRSRRCAFALFHLLQAGARIEGRPIAAKGLTGAGYDGHAFWDTEAFVLPVLTYLEPRIVARRAALAPLDSSPQARERGDDSSGCAARCCRGARSTARSARATGRPAWPPCTSTPTSPTPCAATCRPRATRSSRRACGLELLVETARLWCRLGCFDRDGALPHRRASPARTSTARSSTTTSSRTSWRSATCGTRSRRSSATDGRRAGRRRGRSSTAWRRGGRRDVRPLRRASSASTRRTRASSSSRAWDFDATRPDAVPAAAAPPLLPALPHAGRQAGRPRARAVVRAATPSTTRTSGATSTTTRRSPSATRRCRPRAQSVVAAEVGPRRARVDVPARGGADRPATTCTATRSPGCTWRRWRAPCSAATRGLGGFRDQTGEWRFRPAAARGGARGCASG